MARRERSGEGPDGGPAPVTAQSSFFEQALPTAAAPVDDKAGHRARLRARFRTAGPEAIPDYELIEMVLFRVFPRGDTKPIAKRLLARFPSFADVINASPERLREVEGVGDRAIDELKLIRAAALRLMQGEIIGRKVLDSWESVLAYCRAAQGYDDRERFRILFLDKKNQRRGAAGRHRGSYAALRARSDQAGARAGSVCLDPRPQSPVGRSDTVPRRRGYDANDQGGGEAHGHRHS